MIEIAGMENKSVFETLNNINVNDKTENKNGLTYLPWAWAWGEVKKAYPNAYYTIYENADGWNYFTDGKTGWVKTGVTIESQEHIEYLPIMDYKNKSIPVENITSTDVNTAIQRSLTKACARHGLGLYIYAGEDLPEIEKPTEDGKINDIAVKALKSLLAENDIDESTIFALYNVDRLSDLTDKAHLNILKNLDRIYDKQKELRPEEEDGDESQVDNDTEVLPGEQDGLDTGSGQSA